MNFNAGRCYTCNMKRVRLTREQSRDQTRERLIEAARITFLEKGYATTSVEDIASAAGYTRGAFYSNFEGKPELLIEVLRRDHDRMQADFQAIMDDGGTRTEMEARALAHYSQLFRDDACFPLWAEAKLLAGRDAQFQESFNAFRREKLKWIAAHIEAFFALTGAPLSMPADVLALGLVSLCDGVQSFRMSDPQQVTDDLAESVLATFFSKAILG
ncbi:transcriptional regulator, TetR family [Trinickia caryophylli]|uniref:Transcriptional regulator, TetR family n=2 Tax=Trinickia caryophylli TaxID=28094 RepID=A0A1X7FYZ2_TRICW|nr:transcriptional regulator, TetR family [Trinickia caryophylli]